jgi:hypothetical protein
MKQLAMAAIALFGCTSVRMVERNGCWLKQSSGFFSGTHEELGFCKKPAMEVAQDRVGRLVQECIAQADHRWENRAIAAWGRGQPIPAQDAGDTVAKACMNEAAAMFGPEAENNVLKSRLADLNQEREALRAMAEGDREFFKQSNDRIVAALGEAAKKPAPAAVATATSTGTAKSESEQRAATQPTPNAPATTIVELNGAPVQRAPPRTELSARKCVRAGPGDKKAAAEELACMRVAEPAPPITSTDAPGVK